MSARRAWAWPLVPLYRAGQTLETWLRTRGIPQTRQLQWPVISVGSLSAGGAGKTPVVIALTEMLTHAGWRVDVLSRGYGRQATNVEQVQPEGHNAAARFGDEPVLIAQRAGVPVWVSAHRFLAGQAAEHRTETPAADLPHPPLTTRSVHLLDDGFQHRRLARSVDIVLITAEDLDDVLLPAGNLREDFSALRRADIVVVRAEESSTVAKRIWPLLREGAQMWTVERRLRFPQPLGVLSAGLRPLAFCAIARPEGFASALLAAGCGVIDTVIFPDHATYGPAQIDEIVAFAKKLKATGLVTTEKDAVKLSPEARTRLEHNIGPLCVVALHAVFADQDAVLRTLSGLLKSAESLA